METLTDTRSEKLDVDFDRFKKVASSRTRVGPFLELFERLRVSDMFLEEVKPRCFAHLMALSASKVPNLNVPQLLDAIEATGAARAMYEGLGDDAAMSAFSPFVRRLFETTPLENGPQFELIQRIEQIGIAPDRNYALCMAIEAGAPEAFMDEICDSTFYEYYPTLKRPTAKPEVAVESDI